MTTRILRFLPVIAAFGACLPATAGAQATLPPTGGTPALAPSPFALSGGGQVLLGRAVRFRGTVDRGEAGRAVTIERLEPLTSAWTPEAATTVASDGSFVASWRPRHSGRFQTRAVLARDSAAGTAAASPELPLTVYRPALASWYGPGLFGKRTACGNRLSRSLLGVAHRRLPCGTSVALHYRDRTLVVPVVDRGPFTRGTEWDLTAATAAALGFAESGRLGAVPLR
ncbi:MAG: septal ring lytic transglycosylase RlpA family protein [Actinomycetota bacterium]|nr:septal ring lytic transglycosylase RlpA family protein [Actinomycetota bacterium]